MLILRSSPLSPFGRKVKVAAQWLGLKDRIEVRATDTLNPEDSIREQNPLGKIPCLIDEDGVAIYDSAVIIEYLEMLAGGDKLFPATGIGRIRAMTGQALVDGLMEAALLIVQEGRFRKPEQHSETWISHQHGKIDRALKALAANPPESTGMDIVALALACALDYLDFRAVTDWRAAQPALIGWREAFGRQWPEFEASRPA